MSKKRPQAVKIVVVNTDEGQRQVSAVKVGKFNVDVVDVREATTEELAHGRVHG